MLRGLGVSGTRTSATTQAQLPAGDVPEMILLRSGPPSPNSISVLWPSVILDGVGFGGGRVGACAVGVGWHSAHQSFWRRRRIRLLAQFQRWKVASLLPAAAPLVGRWR